MGDCACECHKLGLEEVEEMPTGDAFIEEYFNPRLISEGE